jgi:hypothetical protein
MLYFYLVARRSIPFNDKSHSIVHPAIKATNIDCDRMDASPDAMLFRLFAGPARLVRISNKPETRTTPFKLFGKIITHIEDPIEEDQSTQEQNEQFRSILQRKRLSRSRQFIRPPPEEYIILEESDIEAEPRRIQRDSDKRLGHERHQRNDHLVVYISSDSSQSGDAPISSEAPSSSDSSDSSDDETAAIDTKAGSLHQRRCDGESITSRLSTSSDIAPETRERPQREPASSPSDSSASDSSTSAPSRTPSPSLQLESESMRPHLDWFDEQWAEVPASDAELCSEDDTSDSDYEDGSSSSNSELQLPVKLTTPASPGLAVVAGEVAANAMPAVTSYFDFLGLSRELRDQIYRCLIPVHISASNYHTNIYKKGATLPRVCRINRQTRAEALAVLYAGIYTLKFESCGPACNCRVANHNSAVTGTNIVYTPSTHMDERFAKIHQYAGAKALTGAQSQAMRSFNRIHIAWILGKYDYPGEGAWGVWPIAKLLAAEFSQGLASSPHEVELSFYWSWLSPNGRETASKLKKLRRWANEFRKKKLVVKTLVATAENEGGCWHLRSRLSISAPKRRRPALRR